MITWLTIIMVGVLTYLTRLSFIILLGQQAIPLKVRRALRFVPAAVLSALIFPALFLTGEEPEISMFNVHSFAGFIAAIVAWRTKNVMLTIIIGMATLLLLDYVF